MAGDGCSRTVFRRDDQRLRRQSEAARRLAPTQWGLRGRCFEETIYERGVRVRPRRLTLTQWVYAVLGAVTK